MTILSPICSEILSFPHIAHGFFTRMGGVSEGIYKTLNGGYGSGDSEGAVQTNRCRVAGFFGVALENLFSLHQAHTTQVAIVDDTWDFSLENRPVADAFVTKIPGRVLSILTADCGPVLFADPQACVIGAAHAGWRGALGGILSETVNAMILQGAERSRIRAVLGPTIHVQAYEVEKTFMQPFLDRYPESALCFHKGENDTHVFFDLPGFIIDRLRSLEIGMVASLNLCTYTDEARFFSYRRACHRAEGDYGRLVSAICLKSLP